MIQVQSKSVAPVNSPPSSWGLYLRLITGEGGFTLMVVLPILVFVYLGSALRQF